MGGGWLDQLKIRLTSAELARLGLSLAKTNTVVTFIVLLFLCTMQNAQKNLFTVPKYLVLIF